ncbi:MAG TPA: methylated-DNA--[protein]-cysteine S-methyltransferase [Pseudonocardiaceae bacterium]|nr:methylated-DNA--[protein]-cysteine S-methyltransferase [Pseudonocardiaceae bacterium]
MNTALTDDLTTVPTPIGELTLAATSAGIVSCSFGKPAIAESGGQAARWRAEAARELEAYFAGTLREFTVPVDLRLASAFERTVLTGLTQVGYGTTTSYGRLGAALGLPAEAVRGVGAALGRNPVWIMVPCHRVVGADGALTGYAGGLAAKRALLDLESDVPRLF